MLGNRSAHDAHAFMLDISGRVTNIPQITTDAFPAYAQAAWEAFGNKVHYAQLIKSYAHEPDDEIRHSPASCAGCKKKPNLGYPRKQDVSTSIVARSKLTIRMKMRRFTQLTNAHSKNIENHGHALAMFLHYYNFCRTHSSLEGKTPAMVAALADRCHTLENMIGLLD